MRGVFSCDLQYGPCFVLFLISHRRYKPQKPQKPPAPPKPPSPPKRPQSFTFQGVTWEDSYSWMSSVNDKVAMRHMYMYMEQEEKYLEAVMFGTEKLQSKLQSEIASKLNYELSSPPIRWGPWLYYRRVEEGKQYPVLCRRLARINEQFISNKSPAAGFDFTTGKKIEQKLLDYNQEAERFGGYAYEELSEISPDHQFLAYTMYDKDSDFFKLSVRNMNSGSLCSKPQADRVSGLAWAKDGQALLYVVTDQYKRPCRIYCSLIGSINEDVLLLDEPHEDVHFNLRNTKDFRFVMVHTFSASSSKVYLINAANPFSGMNLIWECEGQAHCTVEHHQGILYLFTDAPQEGQPVDYYQLFRCPVDASSSKITWDSVFKDNKDLVIVDVDFCATHIVMVVSDGRNLRLCSLPLLLLAQKGSIYPNDLNSSFLPLPKYTSQISAGPNYDYYSSNMCFTISSPVMPDAVVDYDLLNGKWSIIQQQNMLYERTRILYGRSSESMDEKSLKLNHLSSDSTMEMKSECDNLWNDLSEFYACEQFYVSSHDGAVVPLTVVYSLKKEQTGQNPGLLHGHGSYGELLDKRWRGELKSLLDRGWVIAYADVRGGGGYGKRWHHDGRCTKKLNSVKDYISCARFLFERGFVHESKLAGWGYSAGALLIAAVINNCPNLLRAAVFKVPFLDATNTLLHPIMPLTSVDYEEFGYPCNIDEFHCIREYSPYDNIHQDTLYPAVLITSSFNTRFGVWESAKWIAKVREYTIYDPQRPILLNLTVDFVEENRYLQCKEAALEDTFLIKIMESLAT